MITYLFRNLSEKDATGWIYLRTEQGLVVQLVGGFNPVSSQLVAGEALGWDSLL